MMVLNEQEIKTIVHSYKDFPLTKCVKDSICYEIVEHLIVSDVSDNLDEVAIELQHTDTGKILTIKINGEKLKLDDD